MSRRFEKLRSHGIAVALSLACIGGATAAGDDGVETYTAVYNVEYKGKDVGTSQFAVRYDAAENTYEFTSRTQAQGLLKLVRPKPAVARRRFKVVGGHIRPLELLFEDGSRKGEDNQHIEFDWQRRVAVVSAEDGRREVALEDRSLDRGSMQVALMRDLATTGKPGTYQLASESSAQPYVYSDKGEATIATGVGMLTTRAFVQQRENSSRATFFWFAPKLHFLPARIEQRRNGEVQTAMTLASVDGLTPSAN
jgi:hypothetical protein